MSAISCRRALSCGVQLLSHGVERARGVADPGRSELGLADPDIVIAMCDPVSGGNDVGDRTGDAPDDDRNRAGNGGAREQQGDSSTKWNNAAEPTPSRAAHDQPEKYPQRPKAIPAAAPDESRALALPQKAAALRRPRFVLRPPGWRRTMPRASVAPGAHDSANL